MDEQERQKKLASLTPEEREDLDRFLARIKERQKSRAIKIAEQKEQNPQDNKEEFLKIYNKKLDKMMQEEQDEQENNTRRHSLKNPQFEKEKSFNMKFLHFIKIASLSILYLIITLILILLIDLGLEWLLNNVIFNLFDWFNRFSIFIKLFILIIGTVTIFTFVLTVLQGIIGFIASLIFDRLPHNLLTLIVPFLLTVSNSIWFIYLLWNVPKHYNFWVICELILLSIIIWGFNSILMPTKWESYYN